MQDLSPAARLRAINRTTIVSVVVNLLLAAAKVGAGLVGQSHALIADGIHSLSDLASDLLVWAAGRHANQAPDAEHPYGHGRYEALATLALGALLLTVAGGIAWDAIARLFHPETLLQPTQVALYAAAASILVKEWLYWYTLGYAKRVGSDLLRANAWHHRSDAISSILVLAGVAGSMAGLTDLDAVASVGVALMIAKIAWDLGLKATEELVDTGLDTEQVQAIRRIIREIAGVRDVHMLRTRTSGGRASADVHVLVDAFVSVSEGHAISVMVEQRLKREIDAMTDVTVHIDPEDDDRAPPTMGLPLRTEVLARLARLWADIPEAATRKRVLLHYLRGSIEVDLFLPLAAAADAGADPRGLRARLREALAADPIFSRLNVYFG